MKVTYLMTYACYKAGMERIVIAKANALAMLGYDVLIVTTDQKGRAPAFELDPRVRMVDLGINYEDDMGRPFAARLISQVAKHRRHKAALSRLLKAERADVVISTFGQEMRFAHAIDDGSTKVLEMHFSHAYHSIENRKGLYKLVGLYKQRAEQRSAKRYHRFVALTHEDAADWKGCDNICVIPNFTDLPSSTSPLTSKRCIAVGRLSYEKGYDRMIEAWAIVHANYPDWSLHIYGEGPERAHIERLIAERRLDGAAELHAPTEAIGEVYCSASALLLTSLREGMPMVVLEAMAHGVPVVAMACKCGPRDLIDDGVNGLLAPNGDIPAFAHKVSHIITDSAHRHAMGAAARSTAHAYTPDAIMPMWIKLLNTK